MKDVIFVTGGMGRGGAERVISILANSLSSLGYRIHIVQLLFSDCGYELDDRIVRKDFSCSNRNQIIDVPRLVIKLRKYIKSTNPIAVVSFMVTINIVSWISTRGLSVKFIPSERNDPSVGRSRYLQWLQKVVYSNSYCTVFQTKRAQNYFSKKIREKSVIIPNPIIVNTKVSNKTDNSIVTVGRLEKQKNQRMLIEAFADISHLYPEYVLDIYGEGSQRETLQLLCEKLSISNRVYFHGNVKDVHKKIRNAYMFVLTSNFEGLSNALLEAMMLGIPCISTRCSGSDEAIFHGENGLLIGLNNRDELEKAMKTLLENPQFANEIGIKAKEHSYRYEVDNVVKAWCDLIEGEERNE